MLDLDQLNTPVNPAHGSTLPNLVDPALIAKKINDFQPIPHAAQEIIALANSEGANADQFEKLFQKDQILTSQLLKMANSPFFRRNSDVNTIPRAIVVLGINSVKTLVLANYSLKALDTDASVYGHPTGGLRDHSLACAAIAQQLAKRDRNRAIVDELFVAGLLHDIGKVVLGPLLTDMQCVDNETVLQFEQRLTQTDHTQVARTLLDTWRISGNIADWILNHHEVVDGPEKYIRQANALATFWGYGLPDGYPFTSSENFNDGEFNEVDLDELRVDVEAQLEGMDLG